MSTIHLMKKMADHSVVAWNELYESEASWASVFCFDIVSSEKSCFVRELVLFISLRLRVFMFLNATRRDRNCPAFASKGKKSGSMQIIKTKEVSSRSPRRVNWSLLVTFSGWKTFNRKSSKWRASPGGNTTQFPWPVTFPRQRKAALESRVRFATTLSRLNQARKKFYGGITKRMNFNCPVDAWDRLHIF